MARLVRINEENRAIVYNCKKYDEWKVTSVYCIEQQKHLLDYRSEEFAWRINFVCSKTSKDGKSVQFIFRYAYDCQYKGSEQWIYHEFTIEEINL